MSESHFGTIQQSAQEYAPVSVLVPNDGVTSAIVPVSPSVSATDLRRGRAVTMYDDGMVRHVTGISPWVVGA